MTEPTPDPELEPGVPRPLRPLTKALLIGGCGLFIVVVVAAVVMYTIAVGGATGAEAP